MPGGAWLVRLGQRGWFTSASIILLLHTSTASIILLVPRVFLLRALGPRALLLREDCEHVHHLAGQVRPQLDVRKVGVWATSGGSPHGPENTFARLSLSASCLLLLKLLRLYPGQETGGCSLSLVFLYVGSI